MLYKRDSKGKIRTWEVEVKDDGYRTIAGVEGSPNPVVSAWTTCTGKNIGKANEITAKDQAFKEGVALETKKLKEGYSRSVDDIDAARASLVKPMLAENWNDGITDVVFPVYVQPKLDGFRCNTKADGIYSRKNERFTSCPHIEGLMDLIGKMTGLQFDGELYNHDLKEDFNELQSLINRKNSTVDSYKKTEAVVQYHLYDVIDDTKKFSDRFANLGLAISAAKAKGYNTDCLVLVETKEANNHAELDAIYADYLDQGYEGIMIRSNVPYQHKRTKALLKRKPMEDGEFVIVEIEEGKGALAGMAGAVVVQLPNGTTCKAGIKGGRTVNKNIWADRTGLIGKKATVTYQDFTPDGKLRFPVFKTVRTDI